MNRIVWAAVASALLSIFSIGLAESRPGLSLAIGLAAVSSAILATRD
jgi:hypothetical protein